MELISRISGNENISKDQDLTIRSATLLKKITGSKGGADIAIVKKIPIGGGLRRWQLKCSDCLNCS